MYIQITTRCNMECPHCCYSCTTEGIDMSLETYRNVLELTKEHGEIVALGGGEPTIHPHFFQMLCEGIGASEDLVWLATNGKETEIALVLAKMARRGAISCALSLDGFHEQIDEEVIEAFCEGAIQRRDGTRGTTYGIPTQTDYREIRNVDENVIIAGRAKENQIGGDDGCPCSELFIRPDGTVLACGCEDAPSFGNVNTEVNIPSDWCGGECYKSEYQVEMGL